ncbi:hypothetical protein C8F04DRAFT_1198609 [Mycena alexandri]|uniref:Uncharacterized protein n=1 Tax=Mycena alexandri TaxID=1745969 RepID=A0AAD6S134_9AGAR|nr:hypothetical protein C8F04DRAFT_1198609 [Mycena alexandri]
MGWFTKKEIASFGFTFDSLSISEAKPKKPKVRKTTSYVKKTRAVDEAMLTFEFGGYLTCGSVWRILDKGPGASLWFSRLVVYFKFLYNGEGIRYSPVVGGCRGQAAAETEDEPPGAYQPSQRAASLCPQACRDRRRRPTGKSTVVGLVAKRPEDVTGERGSNGPSEILGQAKGGRGNKLEEGGAKPGSDIGSRTFPAHSASSAITIPPMTMSDALYHLRPSARSRSSPVVALFGFFALEARMHYARLATVLAAAIRRFPLTLLGVPRSFVTKGSSYQSSSSLENAPAPVSNTSSPHPRSRRMTMISRAPSRASPLAALAASPPPLQRVLGRIGGGVGVEHGVLGGQARRRAHTHAYVYVFIDIPRLSGCAHPHAVLRFFLDVRVRAPAAHRVAGAWGGFPRESVGGEEEYAYGVDAEEYEEYADSAHSDAYSLDIDGEDVAMDTPPVHQQRQDYDTVTAVWGRALA